MRDYVKRFAARMWRDEAKLVNWKPDLVLAPGDIVVMVSGRPQRVASLGTLTTSEPSVGNSGASGNSRSQEDAQFSFSVDAHDLIVGVDVGFTSRFSFFCVMNDRSLREYDDLLQVADAINEEAVAERWKEDWLLVTGVVLASTFVAAISTRRSSRARLSAKHVPVPAGGLPADFISAGAGVATLAGELSSYSAATATTPIFSAYRKSELKALVGETVVIGKTDGLAVIPRTSSHLPRSNVSIDVGEGYRTDGGAQWDVGMIDTSTVNLFPSTALIPVDPIGAGIMTAEDFERLT